MGLRIAYRAVLITALIAVFGAGSASAASSIVVANANDHGAGSLRQAIIDVEPGGTITIPAGVGEITLETGELVVNKSVTIDGAGSGQTAISGDHLSRVLDIIGSPTVAISGVQIINGTVELPDGLLPGGGILVESGSLTLSDSVVSGNSVDTTGGMSHSGISEGGGIAATGVTTNLTLLNVTVSDNQAVGDINGDGWGGGVYAQGPLVIRGGAVKGNTVEGVSLDGGGIYYPPNAPRATLTNLSVTGNLAQPASGGGANGNGGGISFIGGAGNTLTNVTVANNLLKVDKATGKSGTAEGGGIAIDAPGTTVVNATVTRNTVSANVMSGGKAYGGGISVGALTTLLDSTVAGNTSRGNGAISIGGDLWIAAPLHVGSSIVTDGTAASEPENCFLEPTGSVVSAGGNIDGLDQCGFGAGGDQVNTNPALRPLAENGGPVETMELQPGSPAINAAAPSGCAATDARGVLRPAGAACDVGAFEVATPIAVTAAATGVSGTGATLEGSATNPDLGGGSVSFQYGTTSAYGVQTTAQPIGPTTAGARFAAALGGLAAGTTYHYREVVTNAIGTAVGADATFTTPSPTPTPRMTTGQKGEGENSRRAQLRVKPLGGLKFKLTCSEAAACHAKLIARSVQGRRNVGVGTLKTTVAAGRSRKVTLKLSQTGRRLAAKPGKLSLVVKVTVAEPTGKPLVARVIHRTL